MNQVVRYMEHAPAEHDAVSAALEFLQQIDEQDCTPQVWGLVVNARKELAGEDYDDHGDY